MKIKTMQYDKFSLLPYNRDINLAHVRVLKKAILEQNNLEKEPILVTEDLEVIDGQHRLVVAKELGVPVWYEVVKNFAPGDLLIKNKRRKDWTFVDTAKFWTHQGKKDYQIVLDIQKEFNLQPNIAALIVSPRFVVDSGSKEKFNKGTWTCAHTKERLREIFTAFNWFIDVATNETFIKEKHYLKNRRFQGVLLSVILDGFSIERLVNNLRKHPSLLKQYHYGEDIRNMLIKIHNFYKRKDEKSAPNPADSDEE